MNGKELIRTLIKAGITIGVVIISEITRVQIREWGRRRLKQEKAVETE